MIDQDDFNEKISDFRMALVVWFGTAKPSCAEVHKFIDIYIGWMTAINENMAELMLDKASVIGIVVNQVIEEMDN